MELKLGKFPFVCKVFKTFKASFEFLRLNMHFSQKFVLVIHVFILASCGEGTEAGPCPPGHWTVPVAMAVYLVVTIILLVSLLIAVFK